MNVKKFAVVLAALVLLFALCLFGAALAKVIETIHHNRPCDRDCQCHMNPAALRSSSPTPSP